MSYRKTYEVVGYTYEADTHCLDCATKRFAVPGEDGPEIMDDTLDNEGNPIHPIFLGDEFDYTPFCGTCGEQIDEGLTGMLDEPSYEFTPEGFRAWLSSHHRNDQAGFTCSDGKCPGYEFWCAWMKSTGEDPDDYAFVDWREDTPWLEQFAATLDARYGEPKGIQYMINPVTYGQCLDVLNSISTEVLPGTREETGPMIHSDML